VSAPNLARKELEDSASPSNSKVIYPQSDGTFNVTDEHPLLGIVDVWHGFATYEEAQAFVDGCTLVGDDIMSETDIEIAADRLEEMCDHE
jgi:hypothetical protein